MKDPALSEKFLQLDREVRKLKQQAERVEKLSQDFPAAERNIYMILRHLEMLEMEICDVVTALSQSHESTKET